MFLYVTPPKFILVFPLFQSPLPPVSPHTTPLHYYPASSHVIFLWTLNAGQPNASPVIIPKFLIYVALEVVTMAMVGITAVLPTLAPLSAMILPMVSPSSAPTRFLFDAFDNLSKMNLNNKWSGSIKLRTLPVYTPMVGLPLDKTTIEKVDICDYLGWSSLYPFVGRLYLDPKKCYKPPIDGESLRTSPNWTQLKDALQLAAYTSELPVMCNGGRDNRTFRCKLRNHLYRPPMGKKDNAPWQDDFLSMDTGGRRTEGRRLQSKRTRTTQVLTSHKLCPFKFIVKWDFFGFYVTVEKKGFGCPNHKNHIKEDLSKCPLPIQLISRKEKEILQSVSNVGCMHRSCCCGKNYVFSKLGNYITKAQIS
jgi:hypothetical protein